MSSDKTVAMIVEDIYNLGRLCRVRGFEVPGEYDLIGFNLHETWRLAARMHFKILKVRRTVNV